MKTLQEYTSQELYNELNRRNEDIHVLEINCLNHNGITIKDVVVKYGNDGYNCFLYAPHIKKDNGSLEFIYYEYELTRKIMPGCFCEEMEGIFSSTEPLEKSLDILKKCGISCKRDDNFFQDQT